MCSINSERQVTKPVPETCTQRTSLARNLNYLTCILSTDRTYARYRLSVC